MLDFIDENRSGLIEKAEFIEKIKSLNDKFGNKEQWMCSRTRFLNAIVDEYEEKLYRDFETLKDLFYEWDIN